MESSIRKCRELLPLLELLYLAMSFGCEIRFMAALKCLQSPHIKDSPLKEHVRLNERIQSTEKDSIHLHILLKNEKVRKLVMQIFADSIWLKDQKRLYLCRADACLVTVGLSDRSTSETLIIRMLSKIEKVNPITEEGIWPKKKIKKQKSSKKTTVINK